MSQQQSRRDFIRAAALTGAGVWMADKSWAVSSPQHRIIGANDRIKFACIGVGGKGESDSHDAARFGDIIAICDVDDNTLNSCANRKMDRQYGNAVCECQKVQRLSQAVRGDGQGH